MNKFILKFLWLDKTIAVSLDQKVGEKMIPLTEYYFWPQSDAWEEMKSFLERTTWISSKDSVDLLNEITEVINCWQERKADFKGNLDKIKSMFPSVLFVGYD